MIDEGIKREIVETISAKKPHKVILFGSHARGDAHAESDVDLLVVLDKEGVPRSYRERSTNYLEISKLLRQINKRVAMDLLVLTKTQWEKFVETRSAFSREILTKGIELV